MLETAAGHVQGHVQGHVAPAACRAYLTSSSLAVAALMVAQSPLAAGDLLLSAACWRATAEHARLSGRGRESVVARAVAAAATLAAVLLGGVMPPRPWSVEAIGDVVLAFNVLTLAACRALCCLPRRRRLVVLVPVAAAVCAVAVLAALAVLALLRGDGPGHLAAPLATRPPRPRVRDQVVATRPPPRRPRPRWPSQW